MLSQFNNAFHIKYLKSISQANACNWLCLKLSRRLWIKGTEICEVLIYFPFISSSDYVNVVFLQRSYLDYNINYLHLIEYDLFAILKKNLSLLILTIYRIIPSSGSVRHEHNHFISHFSFFALCQYWTFLIHRCKNWELHQWSDIEHKNNLKNSVQNNYIFTLLNQSKNV